MSIITLWTASGVMISWMEGFRKAYHLPKVWGMFKERMVAFLLVILAGVPWHLPASWSPSGTRSSAG